MRRAPGVLSALAALLLVPAPSPPSPEPVAGKVVYSISQGDAAWLETADIAVGEPRTLTPQPTGARWSDDAARWSRDGLRVAFLRGGPVDAEPGLYVVNEDGTGLRRVYGMTPKAAARAFFAGWSPDGTKVAIVSPTHQCSATRPVDLRFHTVDVATGTATIVHALRRPRKFRELGSLEWSPDGTRLLYAVDRLDNLGRGSTECRFHRPGTVLFSIASDGTQRRRLATGEIFGAEWSPDGMRIAYEDCYAAYEFCDIYVVRADGSGRRLVADDVAVPGDDIEWLPDGKHVALATRNRIVLVDVDAGTRRRLVTWSHPVDDAAFLGMSASQRVLAVETGEVYDDDFNVTQVEVSVVSLVDGHVVTMLVPSRPVDGGISSLDVYLP